MLRATEHDYEKEINEIIAKLFDPVEVIQVCFNFPGFNFSSLWKYLFVSCLKCVSGWGTSKNRTNGKEIET